MTALLVTIPLSHYCEKVRWGLDRLGVAYVEDGHMPLFHWWASFRRGGRRTVPVLATAGGVFHDSTAILEHVDVNGVLYPPEHRAEIQALEEGFDTKLGPATRRWWYFWAMPDKPRLLAALGARTPAIEQRVFSLAYVPIIAMMRRAMKIDAAGMARSLERTRAIFAEIDARLADGRRYLVGDRFTAADLTFAALAAPVLAPDGYFLPLPNLDALPPDAAAVIRELRATPAGRFAQRMFTEERSVR